MLRIRYWEFDIEKLISRNWYWEFDIENLILRIWYWEFDIENLILRIWYWELWIDHSKLLAGGWVEYNIIKDFPCDVQKCILDPFICLLTIFEMGSSYPTKDKARPFLPRNLNLKMLKERNCARCTFMWYKSA